MKNILMWVIHYTAYFITIVTILSLVFFTGVAMSGGAMVGGVAIYVTIILTVSIVYTMFDFFD